jgi:hypothetical protein
MAIKPELEQILKEFTGGGSGCGDLSCANQCMDAWLANQVLAADELDQYNYGQLVLRAKSPRLVPCSNTITQAARKKLVEYLSQE